MVQRARASLVAPTFALAAALAAVAPAAMAATRSPDLAHAGRPCAYSSVCLWNQPGYRGQEATSRRPVRGRCYYAGAGIRSAWNNSRRVLVIYSGDECRAGALVSLRLGGFLDVPEGGRSFRLV